MMSAAADPLSTAGRVPTGVWCAPTTPSCPVPHLHVTLLINSNVTFSKHQHLSVVTLIIVFAQDCYWLTVL